MLTLIRSRDMRHMLSTLTIICITYLTFILSSSTQNLSTIEAHRDTNDTNAIKSDNQSHLNPTDKTRHNPPRHHATIVNLLSPHSSREIEDS